MWFRHVARGVTVALREVMKKLAVLLLACVACTSGHPADTTDGTWSVELQLSAQTCGDPEPAEVSFLVQVARPSISTAGLVAPVQTVVDCGGGGEPGSGGSDSNGSNAPGDTEFTPATTIQAATASHLAFEVNTSTDPTDPMITNYVMDLSDDELLGTAAYQATSDCNDIWTLVANRE
jgi:hypothetical protein